MADTVYDYFESTYPDPEEAYARLSDYFHYKSIFENEKESERKQILNPSFLEQIERYLYNFEEQPEHMAFWDAPIDELKRINEELFGASGVWASQARIFARSRIIVPTVAACRTSALNSIKRGQFLKSTDPSNQVVLANAVCERIISIAKSLKQADDYFATPVCDPRAVCSDIAGAILRASSLAADLGGANNGNNPNNGNKLCIAIASDMLNESPGVSTTSILNSKHVAKTATSLESAKATGVKAARSVGIRFPSDVSIRVVIVGIGTGQNPLPLDRNSYLLAYWEGFLTQSGVRQTDQAQSLNQTCS